MLGRVSPDSIRERWPCVIPIIWEISIWGRVLRVLIRRPTYCQSILCFTYICLSRLMLCEWLWVSLLAGVFGAGYSWSVFKYTEYESRICNGFIGYADADAFNICRFIGGAAVSLSRTRADNRAVRDGYGIGISS